MAFVKTEKVAIRGISGCVPSKIEENIDLPFYESKEEANQVIEATGIERRHIAPDGITASDLCQKAATKLIEELNWDKESIGLIAFCTQNPDYVNHPNSFVIHEKLGLPESTMCLDFYHGCPGWTTTLCAVTQIMMSGNVRRALILDGDTVSRDQDASNREERPLFGDAGTATALEFDLTATPMFFNIGTKSEDGKALIKQQGAFREPFTLETLDKDLRRKAATLLPEERTTAMDSMDVFSFAITKVPKAIKKLCSEYDINLYDIDNLVLHQANKVIIDSIAKRLKIPNDKVVIGLRNYGNTTSASIPMAIISERAKVFSEKYQRNVVCGFGTGLAWGAVYFETNKIVVPEMQEI